MEGNKIAGIIIIIALILSVVLVGYNSINSTATVNEDVTVVESVHVMEESELNQTLIDGSENSNLTTINLNINQETGGSKIEFMDNTTQIYKVVSKDDKNATPTTVTTNQENDKLDVNINSKSSDNTIMLSNKYNYNISGRIVAGGLTANLNNASKVSDLSADITAGGVSIKLGGGTLNSSNIKVTTGGLDISGQPVGVSQINSKIDVGGVNLHLNKPVADIFSNVEVGGINPGDYQKISNIEYKGNEFDSSENKLILNSSITLGGLNTQPLPISG